MIFCKRCIRHSLINLTYLINIVKVSLHALDGNIFPCFNGLSFQYLRECALTLLAYQAILYRNIVNSSDIWLFVKRERRLL